MKQSTKIIIAISLGLGVLGLILAVISVNRVETPVSQTQAELKTFGRHNLLPPTGVQAPYYSKALVKTNLGDLTLIFYTKAAPKTCAYFMDLAASGVMSQLKFLRLARDEYLISDSWSLHAIRPDGALNPTDFSFIDEINEHKVMFGTVAMVNETDKSKGPRLVIAMGSKFNQAMSRYTVFARVVGGMEILDRINSLKTDKKLKLLDDVIITDIKLLP